MCTLTQCVNKGSWEKGVHVRGMNQNAGMHAWLAFCSHPLGCGKNESRSQWSGGGWTPRVWRMFGVERHVLLASSHLRTCADADCAAMGGEAPYCDWVKRDAAGSPCSLTIDLLYTHTSALKRRGGAEAGWVSSSFNVENHLLPGGLPCRDLSRNMLRRTWTGIHGLASPVKMRKNKHCCN